MYIAFSSQTHKLYAKILCRHFRHCAPILCYKNKYVMYQFVQPKKIIPIVLKYRDINILKTYGWYFVRYNSNKSVVKKHLALTCVQFTKSICGIKNKSIQTPDALLKYLMKQ